MALRPFIIAGVLVVAGSGSVWAFNEGDTSSADPTTTPATEVTETVVTQPASTSSSSTTSTSTTTTTTTTVVTTVASGGGAPAPTSGGGGTVTTKPRTTTPPTQPATSGAEIMGINVDACIEVTNQYRRQYGLPDLKHDARLDKAAALHSADQAMQGQMTHTGSNGSNGGQRMAAQGYGWSSWGENVAFYNSTGCGVIGGWYNHDGHRQNILDGLTVMPADWNPDPDPNKALFKAPMHAYNFKSIGLGAARMPGGGIYWTMDLAG